MAITALCCGGEGAAPKTQETLLSPLQVTKLGEASAGSGDAKDSPASSLEAWKANFRSYFSLRLRFLCTLTAAETQRWQQLVSSQLAKRTGPDHSTMSGAALEGRRL